MTDLIAPDHFAVEIAHVLGTARYKGRLSAAEADAYLDDLMTSLPEFVSSRRLHPRAFEIARHTRIGVYDALYLALGEEEGAPVVTADKGMAAAKPGGTILIENLPLPPAEPFDPRRPPR